MTDIVERLRKLAEDLIALDLDMRLPPDSLNPHLAADEIERLRLSLSEARATGRREGMEEAAAIGYWICAETRHVTLGDKVAAAIRAAMEK